MVNVNLNSEWIIKKTKEKMARKTNQVELKREKIMKKPNKKSRRYERNQTKTENYILKKS